MEVCPLGPQDSGKDPNNDELKKDVAIHLTNKKIYVLIPNIVPMEIVWKSLPKCVNLS